MPSDLTQARRRLEGDIADNLIDHLSNELHLPGGAAWPDDQMALNFGLDDDPGSPMILKLGDQLVEVEIGVHVAAWRPPGWSKPPQFDKGDIVMVSGPSADRWVVREVLGNHDDPRPGYLLDFVTSLDPFSYRDTGRIALPDEVFAPVTPVPAPAAEGGAP